MREWVIVLAERDADLLGAVRTLTNLRVGACAGEVWLRGLPALNELPLTVRSLPAIGFYTLGEHERLFPAGSLTPTAVLPALTWQPIQAFFPLELPTAALPAQAAPRYQVKLIPSSRAEAGAALLTTLDAWHAYADTAPLVRLQNLRFAASAQQQVLLLGSPLPPLLGQEYWRQADLLLPAGYDFEAPLLAPLLTQKLNPAHDALLLFSADGSWERVPTTHLVPASRSAVRVTVNSFRHA